ncbi:MAG: glutathione S-transferase [Hydrogenophaga sp.]|nr:glutathione S-transferase [Hydrogenophaga sp.]
MRLHWSPKSPYVRKVMVCAHELDLLPQLELVRSVAAMLKPNERLMQDNPLSKIPTLVLDNGLALFDSGVICEYLDDLAGGALFPKDPGTRWPALRWQALGNGLLDALILWRNERERDVPLAPLMDAFALKTDACLQQLENETAALTDTPLSIGHIAIGCALGYIDYRFENLNWRASAPQLAAWHHGLCERPSFQATAPVDG